jgi:hypothetical protein
MAVDVSFNEGENFFTLKVSGDTSAKEIGDAFATAVEDPAHHQNMNCMWDAGGVKLSQFSIAQIRELATVLRQFSARRGAHYKVAITTTSQGDYQLLKVYTTLFRLVGSFRIKVFNDMTMARQWITTKEAA